jgi:hypothetical protein
MQIKRWNAQADRMFGARRTQANLDASRLSADGESVTAECSMAAFGDREPSGRAQASTWSD